MNHVGRDVVEGFGDLEALVNCFVDRCAMGIIHPQAVFGQDVGQCDDILLVALVDRRRESHVTGE